MKRDTKNQLLKVLMGTGLYLLDPLRDRFADKVSDISDRAQDTYQDAVDRVSNLSDSIRGRFERPSRLKWMLIGVGVGVGVGMLLAPVTGREARETLSDKVQDIGGRVRDRFQSEDERATGTQGM
ncbi:MAG: YtxH domain-containing protein [Acidobacteria bacterium]|nr:YtxH domain-containing protein [Acidobacteriota bacterium]MBV9481780.1 YtxH domain-containing protein [Acidobacteriota bacterium]